MRDRQTNIFTMQVQKWRESSAVWGGGTSCWYDRDCCNEMAWLRCAAAFNRSYIGRCFWEGKGREGAQHVPRHQQQSRSYLAESHHDVNEGRAGLSRDKRLEHTQRRTIPLYSSQNRRVPRHHSHNSNPKALRAALHHFFPFQTKVLAPSPPTHIGIHRPSTPNNPNPCPSLPNPRISRTSAWTR